MALPLNGLRLTCRRVDGETLVYPRLMRDRSWLPKVGIAIQYFEGMLGRERRELDLETLVHFLGDHRLARCVVGAMGRSYRFRPPLIRDLVSAAALRRMQRQGVDTPMALRLRLYDEANGTLDGFAGRGARAELFGGLERTLRLRSGELEKLLVLDTEEHAQLVRVGERPRAEDVAAHYNVGVLDTLLRHAELVQLRVEAAAELALGLDELCRANGVEGGVNGGLATLVGRQDAMGLWGRHGRRVARTLIQFLGRSRGAVVDGSVFVQLKGRPVRLALTPELLDVLAGANTADAGWEAVPGWSAADVAQVIAVASPRPGWSIRRLPDPQGWASGVVVPDLLLATELERVLVCVIESVRQAARLATVAPQVTAGEPLVFVGPAAALEPLAAAGARVVPMARLEMAHLVEGVRATSAHLARAA
ncbi:MAG TPA: DUF790 family protein [Chloroflexota bacterium]|nr:DUF790 family protein [Chloroflexota bacterium]